MSRIIYKWGFIAAGVISLVYFIFLITGFIFDPGLKAWQYILQTLGLGVCLYLGLQETRRKSEGLLSFGRCVMTGFLISALAGVTTGAFSYVYLNHISPGTKTRMLKDIEIGVVQMKDSTLHSFTEYESKMRKQFDSIYPLQTQQDKVKYQQAAKDSTAKLVETYNQLEKTFDFGNQVILFNSSILLFGLLLTVFIAAFMVNKKI